MRLPGTAFASNASMQTAKPFDQRHEDDNQEPRSNNGHRPNVLVCRRPAKFGKEVLGI